MSRILVAGETLVDFIPFSRGPLTELEGFTHRPGGAPANVAVGLKSLGSNPYFWTRLCDDEFGDYLGEVLLNHGVDDSFVKKLEAVSSTLAVVTYDEEGSQEFSFYGDPAGAFGFQVAGIPDLRDIGWVHLGGVVLAKPEGRASMMELLERAVDRGCTVSFDPNVRPDLWDGGQASVAGAIRQAIGLADIIICSREDMTALAEVPTMAEQMADWLLNRGPHTVFITRGEDGAIARSRRTAPWGKSSVGHPGFTVESVDDTGAGDAFTAAVIHRLRQFDREESLTNVVEFANAAAIHAIRQVGAIGGVPDESTVRHFIAGTDTS